MNRKTICASIIAVLAAQAVVSNAAERVDPGNRASMKAMLGTTNIYKLTNSGPNELQQAFVQDVGNGRLVRFEQYHLGVPVFGGSLVMETDGSAVEGLVKRVGGGLLTGLDVDIPNTGTAIDAAGALNAARRHLKVSSVGQPPNEKNRLFVKDSGSMRPLFYEKTLIFRLPRTPWR